jgi:hypothetical protein
MASLAEHTANLREALGGAGYSDDEAERMAPFLADLLKFIEASDQWAFYEIALIRGDEPPPAPETDAADGEFAFALYWLHNPPEEVQAFIDGDEELSRLWPVLAAAAPRPAFTPEEFSALCEEIEASSEVWAGSEGVIYGIKAYEQLNWHWAWCLVYYLYNRLCGIPNQGIGTPSSSPIPLQANANGNVRIAIIGDWGTGPYSVAGVQPAVDVMTTIRNLKEPADYIIHLGDTYYCGTGPDRRPKDEELVNLVETWKKYGPELPPGRAFTINSNHEMYGAVIGLFDVAYNDPLFGAQAKCSYFALTFGDWVIAGLDSAYYDPSAMYMKGSLGKPTEDAQYGFLDKVKGWGSKRVLLSHHTGIDFGGTKPMPLWDETTGPSFPDYWYWGHTHVGIVYGDQSLAGLQGVKARCIGHSAIPFANPWGLEGADPSIIEWYSRTPLDAEAPTEELALPKKSYRAKNGFAVLTLGPSDISEAIFEAGNTTPVWTSS